MNLDCDDEAQARDVVERRRLGGPSRGAGVARVHDGWSYPAGSLTNVQIIIQAWLKTAESLGRAPG